MKPQLFILCLVLSFMFACGGSAVSEEAPVVAETDTLTETSTSESADDPSFYAWVNNLNIRSEPTTSAEVVATAQPEDALTLIEQSPTEEEIVLRGVLYKEPWLKVKTPDGKEGWVFGGAVKRANEVKGNAPLTDEQFSFPYFGQYYLNEWEELKVEQGDDEGDFDTETHAYQRGNQLLEIYTFDGEYGYGYNYSLKTTDGKLLKERSFNFSNDIREIEETVKDYIANPPREYSRKQAVGQSSFQLKTKPLMLSGPWTEKVLSEE